MAKTKRIPRKRRAKHPVFQWRETMRTKDAPNTTRQAPVTTNRKVLTPKEARSRSRPRRRVQWAVLIPVAIYAERRVLALTAGEAMLVASTLEHTDRYHENKTWSRRVRVRKV